MIPETRTVVVEAVESAAAAALLRAYIAEMIARYWNRPATTEEIDAELRDDPSADLAPPTGTFLVIRDAGRPLGCVGIRFRAPEPQDPLGAAELKRMFVIPAQRGTGAGRRLLAAAEDAARAAGARTLRLDTRHDLVEARGLYVACGFVEVAAFNDGPHAERWYAKEL